MRSAYEIHIMLLEEARHNVRPECEGDSTVIFTPTRYIFVRIRPEQIAKQATIRNLRCISMSCWSYAVHPRKFMSAASDSEDSRR